MKQAIISIFFIIFFSYTILAFDWNNEQITEIENVRVISVTNTTYGINTILQDNKKNLFTVVYKNKLDNSTAIDILNLKKKFYGWTDIKIKNIKFVTSKNKINIFITPEKIVINKTNIAQYMPSDIFFIYDEHKELQYNFRMNKENFFMRIKGYYISEQELINKMYDAVKNPSAYIKKRDPEYFLSKLEQLQEQVNLLIKENNMLKWAVITLINDDKIPDKAIEEVVKIKKTHPKYDIDKIQDELDKKDIDLSTGEINIILTVYFNEFDD